MYLCGNNIYENEAEKKLYAAAECLLRAVGIPSNYNGFYYIMVAAVILVKETRKRPNVTSLYRSVAKKYGKTISLVECGIRYAVSRAWEATNHDALNNLLTGYTSKEGEMPSNMQFIRAVAENIQIMLS
jgi:hypothetical protein